MPRKTRSAARIALSALLILTGLYVICLVGLTLAQRRLLYHPCRVSHAQLQAVAENAGFISWENSEGQAIGWYRAHPSGEARRCILLLHGNSGCAPDWFHYADAFQAVESTDFFILEYPG